MYWAGRGEGDNRLDDGFGWLRSSANLLCVACCWLSCLNGLKYWCGSKFVAGAFSNGSCYLVSFFVSLLHHSSTILSCSAVRGLVSFACLWLPLVSSFVSTSCLAVVAVAWLELGKIVGWTGRVIKLSSIWWLFGLLSSAFFVSSSSSSATIPIALTLGSPGLPSSSLSYDSSELLSSSLTYDSSEPSLSSDSWQDSDSYWLDSCESLDWC